MKQCLKIAISGKVQGVGYRAFVKKHAEKLGVEGTVENADDGGVVMYACGPADHLDMLIDVLYKGVKNAKVENVAAESLSVHKDFRGVFRVIGQE